MTMPDQLQSLTEVQDIVATFAPEKYYSETYRPWEQGHLPALCEHLGDWEPRTVLDVGPGWGVMAVWFARQGWEVAVMDGVPQGRYITEDLCAEYGITYHRANIEGASLDQQFRLVTMTQVIPHLRWRPDTAVANVAAMLKPRGTYICSVLDKAIYATNVVPHYAHWRDVPRQADGVPARPESETCMYLREDLRALLEGAFCDVWTWQPEGCETIFAECRQPRRR